MQDVIYEGQFQVQKVYDLTREYDKLTKVDIVSNDAKATLDVFTELYPKILRQNAKLDLKLCTMLGRQGQKQIKATDQIYSQDMGELLSQQIQNLDLIMHGTVYEFQQQDDDQVQVFISFGGLQFVLQDHFKNLEKFKIGQKVYLVCYNTK